MRGGWRIPGRTSTRVCTNVLADIALRWRWFEILRVWLRRPIRPGRTSASRWPAAPRRGVPIRPETRVETDDYREIEVFPTRARPAGPTPWRQCGRPERGRPAVATSAAVRIAVVRPLSPPPPSADVEAVIAWCTPTRPTTGTARVTVPRPAIAVAVMFNV